MGRGDEPVMAGIADEHGAIDRRRAAAGEEFELIDVRDPDGCGNDASPPDQLIGAQPVRLRAGELMAPRPVRQKQHRRTKPVDPAVRTRDEREPIPPTNRIRPRDRLRPELIEPTGISVGIRRAGRGGVAHVDPRVVGEDREHLPKARQRRAVTANSEHRHPVRRSVGPSVRRCHRIDIHSVGVGGAPRRCAIRPSQYLISVHQRRNPPSARWAGARAAADVSRRGFIHLNKSGIEA